jgi:ABC-type uncharacterized transport system permease subunit
MWVLHFVPDNMLAWIMHIILILGIIGTIVGFFLQHIPGILQYRIPIKIISTILLLSGIYFEGSYSTEMVWRERVSEVEARVAIAEAKSQEVNTIIQEKVVEKIKIVKERVVVNHNIIKNHKEIINAECKIPDIAFQIYNTAIYHGGMKHE